MNRSRYATDAAVGATVAVTSAAMPAGGSGADAGAWSSAADRNTAIAKFALYLADVANIKVEIAALRVKLGI